MPRFTVLHGERQEGRRENGEDADVKKYVEMLNQAGFETAISHVFHPERTASWREGPSVREMLGLTKKPYYYDHPILERKTSYSQSSLEKSEETVQEKRQQ